LTQKKKMTFWLRFTVGVSLQVFAPRSQTAMGPNWQTLLIITLGVKTFTQRTWVMPTYFLDYHKTHNVFYKFVFKVHLLLLHLFCKKVPLSLLTRCEWNDVHHIYTTLLWKRKNMSVFSHIQSFRLKFIYTVNYH
jgi:hypothetical protein